MLFYLDRIKAGIQNAVTEIEILKETPTTAVIDGHHGMGQVIGHKAMSMAIEKAKKYGMGMVVVRNSCHYGIAGYYTTMATKAGCIGMTGTNARPSVAPTHGVEGMFGTNPFTIGVPTDEAFDFNFDCATSITQNGKVEYYERIGEDVHPGTIIDTDGNAVEGDAGVALRKIRGGTAALTTLGGIGEDLGGYKGYGFALAVEFFSSILQDGAYGKALDGKDENGNIVSRNEYCVAKNMDEHDWSKYRWWRTQLESYADFSALNCLAASNVISSLKKTSEGIEVTLENKSDIVAFFIRMALKDTEGEYIVPAYWNDNLVSLAPGQKLTFTCNIDEIPAGSTVEVEGWNVAENSLAI